MSPELQNRLFQAYPELFDRSEGNPLADWGIEAPDGWYALIERLFQELSALAREDKLTVRIVQIKPKVASLQVRLDGHDTTAEAIINKAEEASRRTCEVCGEPGTLYTSKHGWHWYIVVCPKHRREGYISVLKATTKTEND